jgi:hypothetical protein
VKILKYQQMAAAAGDYFAISAFEFAVERLFSTGNEGGYNGD